MASLSLSQHLLKSLLHYEPDTGIFRWLDRPNTLFKCAANAETWRKKHANKMAGCLCATWGYRLIRIHSVNYRAHRLAWLYVHGQMPAEIDHINRNRADNRIVNLRNVERVDNCRNMPISKANHSGVIGVRWDADRKRWVAVISVNNRSVHLGRFASKELATRARADAEIKYNFHPNHGKQLCV